MDDIHHLNVHIRKHEKDAQKLRQLAETERGKADQARYDGDEGKMNYHLREAEKREAEALQHDQDFEQARSELQMAEAHIADLEKQRDMLPTDNPRRSALENDIARLRGTSFSL